jgi:hypothetical protein
MAGGDVTDSSTLQNLPPPFLADSVVPLATPGCDVRVDSQPGGAIDSMTPSGTDGRLRTGAFRSIERRQMLGQARLLAEKLGGLSPLLNLPMCKKVEVSTACAGPPSSLWVLSMGMGHLVNDAAFHALRRLTVHESFFCCSQIVSLS